MNPFSTVNSWDAAPASVQKGFDDMDGDWGMWKPTVGSGQQEVSLTAKRAIAKSLNPTEQYELSIAVNAAVNSICRNGSKAKVRIFTRTGEEVVGGPLFDLITRPGPRLTTRRLIWEMLAWLNIAGEFALWAKGENQPESLLPLAPHCLSVEKPTQPRYPGDVAQWRYNWSDGAQSYIRGDRLVFDRLFNPNPTSVRGLSPLVTGAVQVSGSYYAERYNKQFFENNAIPSHLLILPEGIGRNQREDFSRRYTQEFGNWQSNAHKVMVVAGKDVAVEQLEQPFQDGAFMEMMKRGDLKVGQLYRVPAVNMGIYDKTRFDTANEERKLFLEETLEPQCELISEALQTQLVDPFFAFSHTIKKRPRKPTGKAFASKALETQFNKALEDRPNSGLVILLDTDTLPIANDVKLARTEHAQKMRETYMISPAKAEEWSGLEFDDERPERDEIWVTGTNIVCITKPELNAQLTPGVTGDGKKPGDNAKPASTAASKPAPKKELTDAERKRFAQVKRVLFDLRSLALAKMADDQLFGLADGDALNTSDDKAAWKEVRICRDALRRICEDASLSKAEKVEAAKAWFGESHKVPRIKNLLGL